jgi:hypothetical protein
MVTQPSPVQVTLGQLWPQLFSHLAVRWMVSPVGLDLPVTLSPPLVS